MRYKEFVLKQYPQAKAKQWSDGWSVHDFSPDPKMNNVPIMTRLDDLADARGVPTARTAWRLAYQNIYYVF